MYFLQLKHANKIPIFYRDAFIHVGIYIKKS